MQTKKQTRISIAGTSFNVICYKSKTLSNGEHPLMLRITKDGKRCMQSLGISVNPKYWDFTKNQPKKNCPSRELIQTIILEKTHTLNEKILRKKGYQEDFTPQSLLQEDTTYKNKQTVDEFYKATIADLRSIGKIGNSYAYLNSYNCLKQFNNGQKLNYYFAQINLSFLKSLETWLEQKGLKETTLSFHFRTLRAAFNKAVEVRLIDPQKNPFTSFKLSKFNTKTRKRALRKEEVLTIISKDYSEQPEFEFAHDVFTFSYLCGGISFVDIANLTQENIQEGRLTYRRQKTNGLISLRLMDQALEIIAKYAQQCEKSGYIFPIYHKARHITPMQKSNRCKKICKQVNTDLKLIGKELGISGDLTTYVARHSFATILKKSGVNIGIISEALGHQDLKTTAIYLGKFDDEQVDQAMAMLL